MTDTSWPPVVLTDGTGKRWVPESALAARDRELVEAKAAISRIVESWNAVHKANEGCPGCHFMRTPIKAAHELTTRTPTNPETVSPEDRKAVWDSSPTSADLPDATWD